jgi:hypothetical protein
MTGESKICAHISDIVGIAVQCPRCNRNIVYDVDQFETFGTACTVCGAQRFCEMDGNLLRRIVSYLRLARGTASIDASVRLQIRTSDSEAHQEKP